ncbi:methyltransferase [Acrocarpospora phusangensis]|uniref:Methyltransferase n=1 Tax=Acrocarpospora phusangensis TaxID=1070424 RepID=A0A919URS6_9ACTN|nr:class I SAM-dependent methyltransferase [Acrocarpospora phusangensis]GIH27828.1 methyltransferase [Acrocarpospora phusangensis]
MLEVVNSQQAEAWNGYEGTHWADHHDRYDAVNSGFNEYVLAAVGDEDSVLDVGCGNGQLTRLAARRASRAHGIDLSAPMLRRARLNAEGITNVTFEQGDAQIHPFPDGAYDLAISRFGIMFFADPVAGFANIARALRPGGRVAFLSMQPLDRGDLGRVFSAMAEHLPAAGGPGDGTGPLSLSDPAVIDDVFTRAGFADLTAVPVEAAGIWGRDAPDAAAFLTAWGPVRFALSHAEAGAETKIRTTLEAALKPHEHPGGVRLQGAAWLISATRP